MAYNVNSSCITEASGTELAGIFLPSCHFLLGTSYLDILALLSYSVYLEQKRFLYQIFLTAILKDLAEFHR
jgi:hypothetical protein